MRIGILGAGQLGQMLALAGYPLGQRFSFLDPSASPSAAIGDIFLYKDASATPEQLQKFLEQVDVVTYEFEHLPLDLVKKIAQHKPVYPSCRALEVCQKRSLEKQLFTDLNIPTAPFAIATSLGQLQEKAQKLHSEHGQPLVLKTLTDGYDGKGQAVIKQVNAENLAQAWQDLGQRELLVETFINFVREVSIIAVRSQQGEVKFYPLAENHHVDGILRYSLAPLPNLTEDLNQQAQTHIEKLLQELDYVGVLTLELFQQADGQLIANEMAPRVHNSGHWSQEGAVTSQFENHLRALSGLPLGSTQAITPTCMVNLIGRNAVYAEVLKEQDVHLHLYGKEERAGRKIGHLNVCAADIETLLTKVQKIKALLPEAPAPKFSFAPES